jgi:hypothetical protein
MTETQKVTLGLFVTAIFSVWFSFAFTHGMLPEMGSALAAISQVSK